MNNNKIKIYYQFATAKRNIENGEKEILKRKIFLEKNINLNSEITLAIPSHGPGSIETEYDEAIAIPNVLDSIIKAEKKNYDVAIISCFSDPGIIACREKVKIPVGISLSERQYFIYEARNAQNFPPAACNSSKYIISVYFPAYTNY